MSSTGIISEVHQSPITDMGEEKRQASNAVAGFPGGHEGVRRAQGTISEVHPELAMVRATDDSNSPVANGQWIELNHSPEEIAERWGTVRIGMRIKVNYTGPHGSKADATIIGVEGYRNLNQPRIENDIPLGLYLIFTPGIGVG